MAGSFQATLEYIRALAGSEARKGRLFERLIKAYLLSDPLYRNRFSAVHLWSEWASSQDGFDGTDIGIDLVAEEAAGGMCAIQCKCYAAGTRIAKSHLDSFIAASARKPFTARMFVDTGGEWGANARRVIDGLAPACTVLRFGDLAERPVNWPDLARDRPEALAYHIEPFRLRPHQEAALRDVVEGFSAHAKGKLIMACGTGKTFTALRIAETIVPAGGRALYLVPSISLFQQSMREWATHRAIPHRYIGICSDTRAGLSDEDAAPQELEIPVTTNPEDILEALQCTRPGAMTAVFCTYHSLGLVQQAQDAGAPPFDLVLCDEAHRTTGIERPAEAVSPFVLVHDERKIRAAKRLYMTATPRLYTAGAKSKAESHDAAVFSMDSPGTYGPEFHRLPFSKAVEQGLLSDYKVVVLAVSEEHVDAYLQAHLAQSSGSINLDDAAKIVGCWQALQDPENKRARGARARPLRRAIAFTNTIKSSQLLEKHWDGLVQQDIALLPENEQSRALSCEIRHVDGKHHALERKARLEWLAGDSPHACRILSNARCLTEGIDVPALDAVLFMSPRNSQVEVVQAVGRAMRKAEGKDYGYIILPVAVPAGVDPAHVLEQEQRFAAVWSVLRALRSHDDRLEAEINQIDLNKRPTERIILGGDGMTGEGGEGLPSLPFPPLELPPGAIYAKIVDKCGDRKYWETWAKDVAAIFSRLVTRIEGLLANPQHGLLQDWFGTFHAELKISINDSISRAAAIDMVAQHILTRPVFEALFEGYDFAGRNPVAQALDGLRKDFGEFGLENETRDLEGFYESVRRRAQGLDNSAARQRVLMELYEKFFATALKKDAERLGIVYTPVEIVDFILHSADRVLQDEFGRSLSDEGVHVLDPFTGTGIFLARLLQSGLIRDADLGRKYRQELHANEIVLLAYYIAAIHIEEAFHGRRDDDAYEPFGGIVLTDTFNLHTDRSGFARDWLPRNSERAERQQGLPIQVIVGNPPWSTGQRSSADDNPNVDYPDLEKRVSETYAAHSTATLKNSLYDTYKLAIRWASDRIGKQGVIALVTNGSWIDGNADSGVRACLAREFSAVHVLHLRGNARTSGEVRRKERDNVFGQGSRAPVAITLLVRNPQASHAGCRIRYRDIGDYLKREEKLSILREAVSIAGIQDWRTITPDRHHDWVGQRDEAYQELFPMGSKAAKSGKGDGVIFRLFSSGYKTSRDAYLYNSSRKACAENASRVVQDYMEAVQVLKQGLRPDLDIDELASRHSSNVRWDQALKDNLARHKVVEYLPTKIWRTQYRPFVKQYCYVDYVLVNRKYQMDSIFPESDTENRAICVPGVGATKPFSTLVVDTMPDLHFLEFGQCFPRFRYERRNKLQDSLIDDEAGLERIDNITDTALSAFRQHYEDSTIAKDAIFDYVYGVLHSKSYREQFANDLAKGLPRVPLAPTFQAFAEAGRKLAELHLG
ncbi:MAG: DEAD/DEAH box helicase family protein, partial [Bryobacterales bacterium]|nr:DEAD/DEAH box helicase family protein [Bryobacterales bacterium]